MTAPKPFPVIEHETEPCDKCGYRRLPSGVCPRVRGEVPVEAAMTLTIGSLFSGIGGLEKGLEDAGLGPTLWQVEQSEYCRAVLAKHWPDATRYEDVRHVGRGTLAPVDVICGGFPCQPHSVAGARLGDADERDLWGECARLIREFRPGYFVGENVPGLLTSNGGRFFNRVLSDLARLGYDAEWRVLSARGVGAPHLRERVFILAYPQCAGRQGSLPHVGLSRGPIAAHAVALHRTARPWLALDDDRECLRAGDGVSVTMERRRLHALGNAVVPQVAEVVGRLILAREAALQEAA